MKIELNPGEVYVGHYGTSPDETTHIILLPGDNDDASWKEQMVWAKSIGGDLPCRVEQSMLFAGFKDLFQEDWYWSNQTVDGHDAFAWGQYFGYGGQSYGHKGFSTCRARAVRRIKEPRHD